MQFNPIDAKATSNLSSAASNVGVSFAGWPYVTGLTVLVNGAQIAPVNGVYTVPSGSSLTVLVEGVQIAVLAAKPNINLFSLVSAQTCGSSPELAKLLSLLLSFNPNPSSTNGISIPAVPVPAQPVRLSDLSEAALLSLETTMTGRSVALTTALRTANDALDQETWTESASRTPLVNDMSVLQSYLDRVLGSFAFDPASLEGFSRLAPSEVAKIPATLRSQGLSFDGSTPVFSWRYGLQRADPATWEATLAYPLDFPQDIQAIFATFGNKPDLGHIGDIDIANGKLYAAIEDEDNTNFQSYVAVFNAKTLQYTGEKHPLPLATHTDGVPWIAVDALRKEAYTVTWSGAAAGSLNVFDLTTFNSVRIVPLQTSFDGMRVQGAKIYDGMLYAASDSHQSGSFSGSARKYILKVDPVSGSVITLFSYDEPHRTEVEGLGFDPNGAMHVIVISPYTTPLYATGTNNPKPFDGSYSIDGDDWNPSGTLRHFTRTAMPLRDQLCSSR
ncbi:MAG: hypothetical protein J0I77_10905 [Rudaea sp.]|uniref:hypothetical protein n=1 Tax=unclassified Rudaea TaxID=2627037 RepID=UPI0010F65278|nr:MULTISPECIES: hypothetical protein [unclassified Rudaea]MBN8886221.1 hypothetical protein [Rudaea sp.]